MPALPNPEGTRALLLDAMGTLVRLAPPTPALTRALAGAGYPNSEERVAAAMRDEIAYYRRHHLEGRTPAAVRRLRAACAGVLADGLEPAPPVPELTRLLVGALQFETFPDALPLLRRLRNRRIRIAVVSDWDCTLAEHLDRLGVGAWIDDVVVSAVVGVAKPDPRVFAVALERLGVRPEFALVCGDDPVRDVAGASAAGIRGVLIDRDGRYPDLSPRIVTLNDLSDWI
jgi:putative hydrolase of the HAD superfamily